MLLRPKDYITIEDKLFFAVVSDIQEDERALTFLRYVKDGKDMRKLNTEQAQQYIRDAYPELVFHSQSADIDLHGIPLKSIKQVYKPEDTVTSLLKISSPDKKQQDAIKLINLMIDAGIDRNNIGITGSLMLNSHNIESDIDMVIYGRENFFKTRDLIKQYIKTGELSNLDKPDWENAWQRRDCDLDLDEYIKHEKRKLNKCVCGDTRIDFTMIPVTGESVMESGPFKKLGRKTITATVIDDTFAFDFPARFYTDHDSIEEIVIYTATYIGQAEKDEKIEARGYVEEDPEGNRRLVVGTSREATGEYIRIIE